MLEDSDLMTSERVTGVRKGSALLMYTVYTVQKSTKCVTSNKNRAKKGGMFDVIAR